MSASKGRDEELNHVFKYLRFKDFYFTSDHVNLKPERCPTITGVTISIFLTFCV